MFNKSSVSGFFIGIAVSFIGFVIIYCTKISWDWEIDLVQIVLGLFIAIYLPLSLGEVLKRKKHIKDYLLTKLEYLDGILEDITSNAEGVLKDEFTRKTAERIILTRCTSLSNTIQLLSQSNCKYIESKSMAELLEQSYRYRGEITENFRGRKMKFDDSYLQLLAKCNGELKEKINVIVFELLNT